jgi:carbon-monoxide dehydrogenase large subunit
VAHPPPARGVALVTAPIRYTGARVKRLEDPRLLRGQGRYVGDVKLPGMLGAVFVRSPHAHARVRGIDASAARVAPGVVAVATARDVSAKPINPKLEGDGYTPTEWPALAADRVRYLGEAVAVVVAETPYAAADAREAVVVDWEPLPAVATIDAALERGDLLFRRAQTRGGVDEAFARADVTLRETFTHERVAPSPIEPRGVVAAWDGDTLTMWASTQTPRMLRAVVAASLGLDEARVRVVTPDVGGAFGLKMHVFPEDLALASLARRLGRPVRWIEERREMLASASQARAQRLDVEVAADATGRVLALRARAMSDGGAYHIHPLTQALEPLGSVSILPGPYRTPAMAYEAIAVRTNKTPLGAYRGVGMTMGAFAMERLLDLLAARVGIDPVEVRRRNLIPRDAYPVTSASGMTYDSGDFPKALEQVLAEADYPGLRREQAMARAAGRLVGVGVACYTEYTGMGAEVFRRRGMDDVPGIEAASVVVDPDGGVRVRVSFPSQGQGHATVAAQIVADRLGIALERVRLESVDTGVAPLGSGTFGSRGTVAMGGSVAVAADRVRDKVRRLAAHLLEAAPDDVVLSGGRAHVRGLPDRAVAFADLARVAYTPPRGGIPGGLEPGLEATIFFDPGGATFSGAVHVALVEVDRDTGRPRVLRYALVEDCGPILNPMLVDGQIHGAVAQGLGETLLESIVYDADGQLLTATLMDYALPRADDVPRPAIGHLETPAPDMPLGVKGMGEGGTIGAPAAIANAVADAVAPLGIPITALPIRPESLVRPRP